jgi:protein-arginine kinase activator protein McsA
MEVTPPPSKKKDGHGRCASHYKQSEVKERSCLKCSKKFKSVSKINRLCALCRGHTESEYHVYVHGNSF